MAGFEVIGDNCVRDGSFGSVAELVEAIEAYLAERDLNPVRYTWRAEGQEILEKIARARQAMENLCNV